MIFIFVHHEFFEVGKVEDRGDRGRWTGRRGSVAGHKGSDRRVCDDGALDQDRGIGSGVTVGLNKSG